MPRPGFFAVVATCVLASAGARADDAPGVENVRFFSLGIDDGLAQSTARAIVQDKTGFLWIASQDGLSRYDGHEFEVFRRSSSSGLPDNHITSLAADGDGALWIGTQAGGLARRDPATGAIEREPASSDGVNGIADGPVTALLWDRELGLWAATGDGVVQQRVDGQWQQVELRTKVPLGPVRNIRKGRAGELMIAARNGVWRCLPVPACQPTLDDERSRPVDGYDVLLDADDSLWVASAERGLYHYSASGQLLERLHLGALAGRRIADNAVRSLLRDAQDRLWIATNNGLSRLSPTRDSLRSWAARPMVTGGLPGSRVHTLFEDRHGTLWLGTWTQGIAMVDPLTERIVSVNSDPSLPKALPSEVVPSLLANADGTLMIGLSPYSGLVHFDLQRGVIARWQNDPDDPSSLSHNFVQHMARDRHGTLWAATQGGGLNRMRADGTGFDQFRHQPLVPSSLASDNLLHLYFDRENTLWVATADAGLDRLCDGCSEFEHYVHDASDSASLGANAINSSFEDSSGVFWVGLWPGGLNRLDRSTGRVERFVSDPSDPASLSSNAVTELFEDRSGRLWVGTQGGGLNQRVSAPGEPLRFRQLTRQSGLGADAIGGIFENQAGQLWISTTAGLSRVDPESWQAVNFGVREGVQEGGYFIGSKARLPDGRLAFGGLRGVTIFDPDLLNDSAEPGTTLITRARSLSAVGIEQNPIAFADQIRAQGQLTLEPPARDISLEFSSLAFSAPDGLRYRYRMDGLDNDWIYAEPRRRFAAYTNLEPGSYLFRVQATIGAREGPETVVPLTVMPSAATHPLAYLAYFVLAASLLVVMGWLLVSRWRDRERASAALRQSEGRLKLALWGTGDELWDLDLRTDRMHRSNPLPFLAIPPTQHEGSTADFLRFVHEDDRELPIEALRTHLRGESQAFESTYRVLTKDGHWCWLRSRGRIVERDSDGRALRISGTVGDITQLKENELELHVLNQALEHRVDERTAELRQANETLHGTVSDLKLAQRQLVDAEKMAALGGLVAGVAHEINTPMGISVTAASHLQEESRRLASRLTTGELSRSDLDSYLKMAGESSEIVLRNLRRADKLVKSFKQVAVDQSSEERRYILLAQYIEEILTSLRPAFKRSQHVVLVTCPADLGFFTMPGAIYQILVNLLMNSLIHAFGPDEVGEIHIEASRKDQIVLLSYADNGCGLSEESRKKIFEPFFTTRRGQGGSGLGMHIVFNLVTQALGGTIECDSAPGQGVYFSIRIPVMDGAAASG